MNDINILLKRLSKLSANTNYNISYILSQISKTIDQEFFLPIISESISEGQLESKLWLVDTVKNFNLGNVFICAGWLSTILFDNRLKYNRCINIDIDKNCEIISKILHHNLLVDNWKFQSITDDIFNINYEKHSFNFVRSNGTVSIVEIIPDTIINTSCEHIANFDNWYNLIPKGKFLILQSNNGFDIPEHVNCVNDIAEFKKQTPLSIEFYSDQKQMPKFTRFMRIGYK